MTRVHAGRRSQPSRQPSGSAAGWRSCPFAADRWAFPFDSGELDARSQSRAVLCAEPQWLVVTEPGLPVRISLSWIADGQS